MTLLADGGATYFFLAALVLSTGFVLFRTQRRLADKPRNKPPSVAPRQIGSQHASRLQAPPEMVRWELQMHELARDVSARVDSKLAALEHLMQAAHREASRLEAAVCEARRLGLISAVHRPREFGSQAAQPLRFSSPAPCEDSEPAGEPPTVLLPSVIAAELTTPLAPIAPLHQASALEVATRQGSCAVGPVPPLAAPSAADRPYARIYALADAGADPQTIAAQVGSPVGEVQLILSLHRRVPS